LKENKNKISNQRDGNPPIGSKNNLLIIIKIAKILIENKENMPILVIKLTGAPVEDKSESIPYLINQLNDDFDFPFFLIGRSKNIPVCLKPI
tara:strand:+ start:485 stop:760 length:276 start_codon:yes stop_codon:yes gene_type:complete